MSSCPNYTKSTLNLSHCGNKTFDVCFASDLYKKTNTNPFQLQTKSECKTSIATSKNNKHHVEAAKDYKYNMQIRTFVLCLRMEDAATIILQEYYQTENS